MYAKYSDRLSSLKIVISSIALKYHTNEGFILKLKSLLVIVVKMRIIG